MTENSEKQALASNVVYVTLGILLTNICLFVGNWAIIRGYGKGIHGQFVWIIAISRLLVLIADLGIASKGGVRLIARQRAIEPSRLGETISQLVSIVLLFGVLFSVAMFAFAPWIASLKVDVDPAVAGDIVTAIRLVASWVLLQVGIRLCMMIFIGLERMLNVPLTNPVGEVLKVVWVFVCMAFGLDLIWLFVGWTGAQILALASGLLLLKPLEKEFKFRIRLRLEGMRSTVSVIANAVPYYVSYVSLLGLPSLIPLLIGTRMTDASAVDSQISFFQVCWSLALVSRFVSATTATAIFPRVAHLDASRADRRETGSILTQVSRIVGLSSSGLFAMYLAFGGVLLGSVYGESYAGTISMLWLLALATAIENYTQQLDQVLMAMHSATVVMFSEIIKLLSAAAIAWWLIPAHGAFGATMAIVAAMTISAIVKIVSTRRLVNRVGLMPFAASLTVVALLWLLRWLGDSCSDNTDWLKHAPLAILPIWLILVLALRLLLPSEIMRWIRIFARTIFRRPLRRAE